MIAQAKTEHSSLKDVPTQKLIDELAKRGAWPPKLTEPIVLDPACAVYPDEGIVEWHGERYYLANRLMRVFEALAYAYPRGYKTILLARYLYPWQAAEPAQNNVRSAISDLRLLFPGLLHRIRGMDGVGFAAYYRLDLSVPWQPPNLQRRTGECVARRSDGAYYVRSASKEGRRTFCKDSND